MAALLERKNAGVASRDQKDRAQIKVLTGGLLGELNHSWLPSRSCAWLRWLRVVPAACRVPTAPHVEPAGLVPPGLPACPHPSPGGERPWERHSTPRPPLQTASDRLADSRAALERKAALYERLARGEEDDDGVPICGSCTLVLCACTLFSQEGVRRAVARACLHNPGPHVLMPALFAGGKYEVDRLTRPPCHTSLVSRVNPWQSLSAVPHSVQATSTRLTT